MVSDSGPEIIAREILRLDAETERATTAGTMGATRKRETKVRRSALIWALHVVLTGDPTQSSGDAVDRFLGALKADAGAST